jgi:predicted ATPase with chaperone activity
MTPAARDVAQTAKAHYELAQRSVDNADFKNLKGQYQAKRAMKVAVAGEHNIILFRSV